MINSDSDSENECFESAEESIDEDEQNDVKTKSFILEKGESEFPQPIENHCSTVSPVHQVNAEIPGNSMSYRKRPERMKYVNTTLSTKIVSKLDELNFKTEKIASDIFLLDITSNLSKNINRSLNTLQQTSSNVKDLILNSLPASFSNDNEVFSYDDKSLFSTLSDTVQDKQLCTSILNNSENNKKNNEESTKEIKLIEKMTFSVTINSENNVSQDIKTDKQESNLNTFQECNNLEVSTSDVDKRKTYFFKEQSPIISCLGSDSTNKKSGVNDLKAKNMYNKVQNTLDPHSESNKNSEILTFCGENDIDKEISEKKLINSLEIVNSQNVKSQTDKNISCELDMKKEKGEKEKFLSHKMVHTSDDANNFHSFSKNIEGTGNLTNVKFKEKHETDLECSGKAISKVHNIFNEEKSSLESLTENSGKYFKGDFLKSLNSKEGWDDFNFSEDEYENLDFKQDYSSSTELGNLKEHMVKPEKKMIIADVKFVNSNSNEQEDEFKDNILKDENQKTSTKNSITRITTNNFNKKSLIDKETNVVENEKTISDGINSLKKEVPDVWDWDIWDDRIEDPVGEEVTEYSACEKPEDDIDISKWSGWDNFGQKLEEKQGNWSLGSWGVDVLLSKATAVTQGISNALEAGLGAPDPETLAIENFKIENMNECRKENIGESQTFEVSKKNSVAFPLSGITNLVAEVTNKIVEHSKIQEVGSKVITGGLDTLETFGKKTMEVLQEGDPGLKNKRAFLLGDKKPVLSQILQEAREKADKELKQAEERKLTKKCHFEILFDDFQGMVHLEALEMLSKQYELKLEQMRTVMDPKEQEDLSAVILEVEQLCLLDECDMDFKTSSKLDFRIKLQMAVEPLKNEISIQKIIQIHEEASNWLQTASQTKPSFTNINQKLVSTLAELTAATIHQFHKSGELLSIKECRKTVEEIDALSKLTNVLCQEINKLCEKFISLYEESNSGTEGVNSVLKNVNVIMTNSTSYIRQAFNLLIPVLQFGAAVY